MIVKHSYVLLMKNFLFWDRTSSLCSSLTQKPTLKNKNTSYSYENVLEHIFMGYFGVNDETNANGQWAHTWSSVHSKFRQVPHQQYIGRFRKYADHHGTKRGKMDIVEHFVYNKFEQSACPVHDNDIKW